MLRLALAAAAVVMAGLSGSVGSPAAPYARSAHDGRIAFERGGALYTIASDGSDLRRLSVVPKRRGLVCDGPAWSPDGKTLAFVGHYASGTLNLDDLLVRYRNGETKSLGDTGRGEGGVSWSPDGREIAVGSGGDEPTLTIFTAATGRSRLIRPPGKKYGSVDGFDPAWSPDGSTIVYRFGKGSLCRKGNCTLALRGLAVIHLDGSGYRVLTRLGGDPSWSPDGREVAFTRVTRIGDIFTETEGDGEDGISVIAKNGSGLRNLTTRSGDRDPAWSPSGLYIVFTRGSAAHPSLWIMRRDGTDQHLFVRSGEKAAWQSLP